LSYDVDKSGTIAAEEFKAFLESLVTDFFWWFQKR